MRLVLGIGSIKKGFEKCVLSDDYKIYIFLSYAHKSPNQ